MSENPSPNKLLNSTVDLLSEKLKTLKSYVELVELKYNVSNIDVETSTSLIETESKSN